MWDGFAALKFFHGDFMHDHIVFCCVFVSFKAPEDF
nr:MAG TPA: hypothetical protein [Caudoviricetes sp.]